MTKPIGQKSLSTDISTINMGELSWNLPLDTSKLNVVVMSRYLFCLFRPKAPYTVIKVQNSPVECLQTTSNGTNGTPTESTSKLAATEQIVQNSTEEKSTEEKL